MFRTSCHPSRWAALSRNVLARLPVVELHVANRRKQAFGLMSLLLSGTISSPPALSHLLKTNFASGGDEPKSSKIKANGRFIAQGNRPYLNLVEGFAPLVASEGLPISSNLVRQLSMLNRTQGQLSLQQTCSMCVDLPLPCSPTRSTRLL